MKEFRFFHFFTILLHDICSLLNRIQISIPIVYYISLIFYIQFMARFERIVALYRQRYQMDLREFMRFLHQKVDSPSTILSQVEQYILNLRMAITEDDIRHYLHIVAAAQEGRNLSKVSPQDILAFNKVKFVRKTRVVDFDQIQVCKIKHFGENSSKYMNKRSKEEVEDPSTQDQECFEILNDRAEEYQISMESSLYQNETSVELLCQDNLTHLFQGNILHTFRELKRTLVQSIEQLAEKEIHSTKFIANYNSHKFVPGSLCLLARTMKNIPFGIFALQDEERQAKGEIKGCLVSLQTGRNVGFEVKRKHQSQNCLEVLMENMGIIWLIREKEGIRLNFSKKTEHLNQLRSIFHVDEAAWGAAIDSIQCFQIQLK